MEINGRRILITGANRGLGHALSLACVNAGAREVIGGFRQPECAERLRADGVTPVKLDVTDDSDIDNTKHLGPIDILINNAGVAGYGNPVSMNLDDGLREN